MSEELSHYKSRGARALVLLHDHYMRDLLEVWSEARTRNIDLPETEDPDYESLDHVMRHILRAGRGYMTWVCEVLKLPDPKIDEAPELNGIQSRAGDYVDYLLQKWREPLANIEEKQLETAAESRWGESYCVDAMLEHAVMHPMRHSFQLRELMNKQ